MKTILLFGAGKSASVLISYLLKEAEENGWKFIIADANREQVLSKTNNSPFAEVVELDINNEKARSLLIQRAHVVISMMPPSLHFLVAKDCVEYRKHLLTASYLDPQIKSLKDEISHRKLLFLCEMGLDPGIDHMSALQLLNEIKASGAIVNSFKSHCGGLVAPESDNNPWHYKISWNPRNIVLAGKAGAIYKLDGVQVEENYNQLFDAEKKVATGNDEVPVLSYYPNRNSLPYIDLYKLQSTETFIRTTLRYTDFMHGWKHIVDLNLTDETVQYQTDGKSLQQAFLEHLEMNGFQEWLQKNFNQTFDGSASTLFNLKKIREAGNSGNTENEKFLGQLLYLGLDDTETMVNKGFCSASDILQFALEIKLALVPGDKDMIVMLHEIEYTLQGKKKALHSSLLVKGDDHIHTAMAKTVGLPLGIAAKLILNGDLTIRGLHVPVIKEIYEPVLKELKNHGVIFHDTETELK